MDFALRKSPLALNKSMRASDSKQGINKLWPWLLQIQFLLVFCQPTARRYNSAHVNDRELKNCKCFLFEYFVRKTLVRIALSTLSSKIRGDKFLARPYFPSISSAILSKLQPLSNKIGRGKNLACLIELGRLERTND